MSYLLLCKVLDKCGTSFSICDGYKKNLNLLPLYNDFPQLLIFIVSFFKYIDFVEKPWLSGKWLLIVEVWVCLSSFHLKRNTIFLILEIKYQIGGTVCK